MMDENDLLKENKIDFFYDDRLKKEFPTNNTQFNILSPFDPNNFDYGSRGVFNPYVGKEKSYEEAYKKLISEEKEFLSGLPSLINIYSITTLYGSYSSKYNKPVLYDIEGERRWYEYLDNNYDIKEFEIFSKPGYSKEPTVENLIKFSKANKRKTTPYYYTDFAYAKFFGKISNNRLITLRRYPFPVLDSLDFPTEKNIPEEIPPVAQAVTWFGEGTGNSLSSILSFSVGLPWEDITAPINDLSGEYPGVDETNMPSPLKKIAMALIGITDPGHVDRLPYDGRSFSDPNENGPYSNKILGGVNRIDSVKKRIPPLNFKHEITLEFAYTLRSIGGINPKAAMLDILANMLILTYGRGSFFGGANRFRGSVKAYPWSKLVSSWYKGDLLGVASEISNKIVEAFKEISNVLEDLSKNPKKTLLSIASLVGKNFAINKFGLRGQAPTLQGLRALLTGEPVGPWHLVIGNPFNPIMMIGNLVCTGMEVSFSDELGADDFPTEMKFKITLSHGMPRDRYGVESMFNKGSGRIYTIPDSFELNLTGNVESKIVKEKSGGTNKGCSGEFKSKTVQQGCIHYENNVRNINNIYSNVSKVMGDAAKEAALIEIGYFVNTNTNINTNTNTKK